MIVQKRLVCCKVDCECQFALVALYVVDLSLTREAGYPEKVGANLLVKKKYKKILILLKKNLASKIFVIFSLRLDNFLLNHVL